MSALASLCPSTIFCEATALPDFVFKFEPPSGAAQIAVSEIKARNEAKNPSHMGVIIPELPPGAIEVSVNGTVAYQFNGIYYQPVFANGITQYQTFRPQ